MSQEKNNGEAKVETIEAKKTRIKGLIKDNFNSPHFNNIFDKAYEAFCKTLAEKSEQEKDSEIIGFLAVVEEFFRIKELFKGSVKASYSSTLDVAISLYNDGTKYLLLSFLNNVLEPSEKNQNESAKRS
jgi:hypothetical protein